MKVSILITTYNLENYIGQTLECVCNQDYDDYEILIGDDGSADATVDIVKQYMQQYPGLIELYVMPREQGADYNRVERASANRINLLRHAAGEYITFLDGDDLYTSKSRITIMVKALETHKDCIMAAHNLIMYYGGDEITGPPLVRARRSHRWSVYDYWPCTFIQSNAIMFRRNDEALKALYGNASLLTGFDDNNITFWLFMYGDMYYIPDSLGAYRQTPESSWNGIDELKRYASHIVGYNVEQSIVEGSGAERKRSLERLIDVRHRQDLQYMYVNGSRLRSEDLEPFYHTAKSSRLKTAQDIFDANEAALKECHRKYRSTAMPYLYARFKRLILKLIKRY